MCRRAHKKASVATIFHRSQSRIIIMSHQTPFQTSLLLEFSLKISGREPGTSKIVSVMCLFCAHSKREARSDAKRRRTDHIHYCPPFRPENYRITTTNNMLFNGSSTNSRTKRRRRSSSTRPKPPLCTASSPNAQMNSSLLSHHRLWTKSSGTCSSR